jgi:F0F1-type ATP synthase membrane subunit b/b'
MTFFLIAALLIGGYVASIYTWPKAKLIINGAETEIRALEDKAKALKAKVLDLKAKL